MTQHNDAIPAVPASDRRHPAQRHPEDIAREISDTRARMDAVIDEIEFRLSPGQMTGGIADVVRDVIQGDGAGTSGRIARAIRANPIPVALIGIGALWLGWAVARTPEIAALTKDGDDGAVDGWQPDAQVRHRLAALVAACRHGAAGFRRADRAIDDGALSGRLAQVADQLDRSATALGTELAHLGGRIDSDAPVTVAAVPAVWFDLDVALDGWRDGARARSAVLAGLEGGVDGSLALFRDVLGEPLSERLQVALGTEFHAIETVRHRVGALREAVA